jgi:hypothetical protein
VEGGFYSSPGRAITQESRNDEMARKGFEPPARFPTFSRFKSHQVRLLIVSCRTAKKHGYRFNHEGRVSFEGLPDLNLLQLKRRIRFRCAKCGGGKVELRPDWASPPERQVRSSRGRLNHAAICAPAFVMKEAAD